MTKAKALKHLRNALEDREFWREKYVEYRRDTRSTMDVKAGMLDSHTIRENFIAEAIEEIKNANERISRFERIVK